MNIESKPNKETWQNVHTMIARIILSHPESVSGGEVTIGGKVAPDMKRLTLTDVECNSYWLEIGGEKNAGTGGMLSFFEIWPSDVPMHDLTQGRAYYLMANGEIGLDTGDFDTPGYKFQDDLTLEQAQQLTSDVKHLKNALERTNEPGTE